MQVFALGDADGKATEADYDKCVAFIFALIDEQNKIAEDSRSRFDKAASDPNGGQLSIADASRIFKNMNAGRCNPNSMRGFSQYRKIGHEVPAVTDSIVDCQPVVPYKKNTFNCRLERYLSDSTKCVVECTGIVFKKSGAGYIIEGICEVESIQKASGDSASAPLR